MAAKSGRTGSAEKMLRIQHTRIDNEQQLEEVYVIGPVLGEGSFGIVKEVSHLATGVCWACKTINKEKAGSSKVKLLEREVSILKQVHHEHIIQLKEVFETSQKMYLIMELCEGGELSNELKTRGTMGEQETKVIMGRLASAISYLHKKDMVHRDIKLENILLSRNPDNSEDNLYIKVTDFGLSVVKDGPGHENMMMDFCGTPMYMAPEILDNKTYGQLCDVWAMGVIMYVILTGEAPFQGVSDEELYLTMKNNKIDQMIESNALLRKLSPEAKSLLTGLLQFDPAYRLSASEAVDAPWISGKSGCPTNVMHMMREYLKGETSSDSAINGDASKPVSTSSSTPATPSNNSQSTSSDSSSLPPSRDSSAKKGKQRTTPRSGGGTRLGAKADSRSPTDTGRQTSTTPPSSSKTQRGTGAAPKPATNHHTARTPDTRTTTSNRPSKKTNR